MDRAPPYSTTAVVTGALASGVCAGRKTRKNAIVLCLIGQSRVRRPQLRFAFSHARLPAFVLASCRSLMPRILVAATVAIVSPAQDAYVVMPVGRAGLRYRLGLTHHDGIGAGRGTGKENGMKDPRCIQAQMGMTRCKRGT